MLPFLCAVYEVEQAHGAASRLIAWADDICCCEAFMCMSASHAWQSHPGVAAPFVQITSKGGMDLAVCKQAETWLQTRLMLPMLNLRFTQLRHTIVQAVAHN